MIAFAIIDAQGVPTGGGIRRDLPQGAIALGAPFSTLDLPRIRWTGKEWVERPVSPPPDPTPVEAAERAAGQLTRAKAEATAYVNARISAVRDQIYTNIAGQDAIYLEKRAEAVAYVRQTNQAGEPKTLEDYPFLDSEVGITAPTAWQLAQIWLFRAAEFRALGAATERARMKASIAIAAARDEAEIETIQTAFNEAIYRLPI